MNPAEAFEIEHFEHVANFLAQGFSPQEVCSIVGTPVEEITNLLKLTEFQELCRSKSLDHQDKRIEKRYNDLEEATLKQLKTEIAFADIPSLLGVIKSISGARIARRPAANFTLNANTTINQKFTKVTLEVPQHAIGNITKNANNEIIALNDRSLAPLPSNLVHTLFKDIKRDELFAANKEIAEDLKEDLDGH